MTDIRPADRRPVVLILGPHLDAVSGVSTHVRTLLSSSLTQHYELVHFQVGSEGRNESAPGRLARLAVSPFLLMFAMLRRRAAVLHLNTSLNARAYWRDLVYLAAARLCGVRVLYQVHGGELPQTFLGRGRLAKAFLRQTLRFPDAVVVLASTELKAYREFVPDQRVLALPNGIDAAPYLRRPRSPSSDGCLRLAYIGRLAREKGLYEMLNGLAIAKAQGSAATLTVGGSGPDEQGLRDYARALGIEREVVFAGPVFHQAKVDLLAAADAFLMASYSEGLPYSILEAMASGAPAITTAVGAIPDVIKEQVHGLFVPLRDAEAIARSIAALGADRRGLARMSSACRSRIASAYSIEKLASDLGALYADIGLGNTKPSSLQHLDGADSSRKSSRAQ